jgi:hypothetical protein
MPPKRANRLPLRIANECGSAKTIRASIGRGTPSQASQICTFIERASPHISLEAEIDVEEERISDYDDEEEEQPEDNHGEEQAAIRDRGDTLRSEFTIADMRDMLEQQRKLVPLLFQNAEMKSKVPTSSKAKDKFKVTHPKHYCGGARELETFLGSHRSNFRTHNHIFSGGDTDKVQYALDHLGSWANHTDDTLRRTTMTNPVTWGHDRLTDDHPCIHHLELLINEIQKQYGDKDRRQNSSTQAYHEMMHGYHSPDENVRAYADRLRRTRRESGWDEEHHKIMLYNVVWAGLKPYLWPKLGPFTKVNGRFDSIDQLFNRAADLETPRKSEKQLPTESAGSSQKGKKGPCPPSESIVSGGGPGSGSGLGSRAGLGPKRPPASRVSSEEQQQRRETGVCLWCGSKDHFVFECTKYSRAQNPEQDQSQNNNQNQPTSSNNCQIKRQ